MATTGRLCVKAKSIPLLPSPFRCQQGTGQLHVIFERCFFELLKFVCLFFLADIGFTLAFYTLLNGTTSMVLYSANASDLSQFDVPYPFSSIGYGMVQLIR